MVPSSLFSSSSYERTLRQHRPPHPLLLLISSYATGTFSSRRIEALTYDTVAVRYHCADRHPDHDSNHGNQEFAPPEKNASGDSDCVLLPEAAH